MYYFLKIFYAILIVLFLSSFTNSGIREDDNIIETDAIHTYKDFILDAYNYRVVNGLKVPNHYYDILGINQKQIAIEKNQQRKRLCDQIPLWIRKGQLMTESNSYYNSDGTIQYVNRKRGGNNNIKKGAIGPFQILRIAWDHMSNENPEFFKGKKYSDMQTDLKLSEDVAAMYLLYIYNDRGNKNWNTTVMLYNRGPWGQIDDDAREYLKKVKYHGTKIHK